MLVRVLFYFSKKYRGLWKKQVTTTEEQRTKQAGCTTTGTEERAHGTAPFTAARKPAACIYFSAFRRMQLTHSAVVSKAYVKKCREPIFINESTTPGRKKKTQKRPNCKQSIRRTKQIRERFRSSRERRPRDASPVSVVYRGQVLV